MTETYGLTCKYFYYDMHVTCKYFYMILPPPPPPRQKMAHGYEWSRYGYTHISCEYTHCVALVAIVPTQGCEAI